MKASLRTTTALAIPALALLCLAAPAQAQTAAPADETSVEIVVTAQKRSENLQSVPVAVSVLSGEALGQTARPSIESASQLVPSLNFLKSGTTLNQTIFLRGVGTATFSIAGEPSVSTVVDGVVYARSGEAFSDLVDIAQMEVLRGPQGTLFGKNASAGVINITTQMPKHEMGGSLEASYFDKNEYRLKAVVNTPLGQDLAARFTGFYGSYDGNIRNTATNSWVNGYKHFGGRAQFLYDPSSDLRIYFAADYHKNNDDCCADIIATGVPTTSGTPINAVTYATTAPVFTALPTPRGADTREISQDLVTATKEEGWGVSLQADVGIGSHTLTSITSYRKWDNTEIRDGDWLARAYVGFNQLHDRGPQTSNTLTQEFRIASPADQAFSYVIGAFYSRADSERTFQRDDVVCTAVTGATGLIPCGSANANPSTFPSGKATFGSVFDNLALFGQGTYKFSDSVRLVGGLRFSHDVLSVFHSRVAAVTGPGIQPNFDQGVYNAYAALVASGVVSSTAATQAVSSSNGVPFRTKSKNDNLSGKISLQADVSPDIMAYGGYTRGYKGPAYNVFFNLTGTGTNALEPETSDAFEVGLKNKLFGGKMILNIAGFYAKYHNFQANKFEDVAGAIVSRFTNAGEVSTKGIEADLTWRPAADFNITGGVAYTDAQVVRFKPAGTAAIIPPGTPLGFAPQWKGSLSADYRIRGLNTVDVILGGQVNFQSSQLSIFDASEALRFIGTIPAYALANLSLAVASKDDKYRLTFQVRNVFDQSYAAAIINGGTAGAYRYQIPRDADRYWGVTGRVSF